MSGGMLRAKLALSQPGVCDNCHENKTSTLTDMKRIPLLGKLADSARGIDWHRRDVHDESPSLSLSASLMRSRIFTIRPSFSILRSTIRPTRLTTLSP
jgi:hypothetical protein